MKNILIKKDIIILILIFFISMQSENALSQSMEETKKAIQQSNDMQGLFSELRICEYACTSINKEMAFNNNPNTMIVFNSCRSTCLENYNSKMSCIQRQPSSKYSPANCSHSFAFESMSDDDSSQKSDNTISSIFWLFTFFLGVRFLLKKKSQK
jgi:hypothetical protein